jgi:hypothetical protein
MVNIRRVLSGPEAAAARLKGMCVRCGEYKPDQDKDTGFPLQLCEWCEKDDRKARAEARKKLPPPPRRGRP